MMTARYFCSVPLYAVPAVIGVVLFEIIQTN